MKAYISIAFSILFFGIAILHLILIGYYAEPEPEGFNPDGINFKEGHNYVYDYLDPFKYDPFDYYTSLVENAIIYLSTFYGLYCIIPVFKLSGEEMYSENYIKQEQQYNIVKKILGKIKNAKKTKSEIRNKKK